MKFHLQQVIQKKKGKSSCKRKIPNFVVLFPPSLKDLVNFFIAVILLSAYAVFEITREEMKQNIKKREKRGLNRKFIESKYFL